MKIGVTALVLTKRFKSKHKIMPKPQTNNIKSPPSTTNKQIAPKQDNNKEEEKTRQLYVLSLDGVVDENCHVRGFYLGSLMNFCI